MVTAVSMYATVSWILLTLVAVVPVQITRTDGETTQASWSGVAESALILEQAGQVSEVPFDDIVSLESPDAEENSPPAMRVSLAGGSQLAAQSVSLTDDQLTVTLPGQNTLQVPVKRVRSIRFRPASPATDSQWLGILESEGSGDVLAIRRDADRLDQVRGIIGSIADGAVHFNIDGSDVKAPFDRLEGIVFGSTASDAARAALQITDVDGSRWMADSLHPSGAGEPLIFTFEKDLRHQIPLERISSVRWNSSLTLLASQAPAEQKFEPYLAIPGQTTTTSKWFLPATDDDEDLLLYGDSTIEYRIEPGFEQLAGSVRRDDEVSQGGRVTASILLDGKQVWSESLEDTDPRGFEVPVGDARRLQFRVETAGDGDLGDSVRITRPRLLK